MPHDDDQPEREFQLEPDAEAPPPIRVAPDALAPETLRAVIESFVLREGTDYGLQETSLDDKVAQVQAQLRKGEAHIVFDLASESIAIVPTRALDDSVI